MASLPSYQEAVGRSDWLELVAPHASVANLPSLCLVSKRFYDRFSCRLWADPLRAARLLGLDPAEDLRWYFKFLHKHARTARLSTRSLVLSLDLRGFAILNSAFDLDDGEGSLSATFCHLPSIFPRLRCILLDRHSDLDPGTLSQVSDLRSLEAPSFQAPFMLSIPHCRTQLSPTFFSSPYLSGLVYIDLSDMSGSLRSSVARSLRTAYLPNLRVLKAQGREVDDATAVALFSAFKEQLWSLDLSRNNLTDSALNSLDQLCFPPASLRSDAHFDTEGKVGFTTGIGTSTYGPFIFLKESEKSGNFSHPLRYMADAPTYTREAYRPLYPGSALRHDGRVAILDDSADKIKTALAGPIHSPLNDAEEARRLDICSNQGGITHLRLNQNPVSAQGLERMIRNSPGQLRNLECDSTALELSRQVLPPSLAKDVSLSGLLGAAHLFRPVFSPNLQALRVHHSLVTRIPSLETGGLVTMANMWLAETILRDRIDIAYPQAFVPDMNPRLYSLTLTHIPRFSTGPVIQRLLEFLRLSSAQERAIQDARQSSSRRSPVMLSGLRHIRLEFDPDPTEELGHTLDSENLDAEQAINVAANEFSFFGDQGWTSSQSQSATADSESHPRAYTSSHTDRSNPAAAKRLSSPYAETKGGEYLNHSEEWNGQPFTVPVWIGTGIPGPHSAVNEYMRLLQDPALRADVRPASPGHVLAGVPAGSYIFHSAWDAILAPTGAVRRPKRIDLVGMRDVLSAIKEYRGKTKAAFEKAERQQAADSPKGGPCLGSPHYHWTGRLEVSLANPLTSSKFWR